MKALRKDLFHASPLGFGGLLAIVGIPWHHPDLCCLHIAFSLCANCLSVSSLEVILILGEGHILAINLYSFFSSFFSLSKEITRRGEDSLCLQILKFF